MSQILTKIFLDNSKYPEYLLQHSEDNSLDSLNRLNIFIGANNSGKSRFLRKVFADRSFLFQIKSINSSKIIELLTQFQSKINIILTNNGFEEVGNSKIPGIKNTLQNFTSRFYKIDENSIHGLVRDFTLFWENLNSYTSQNAGHLTYYSGQSDLKLVDLAIRHTASEISQHMKELIPDAIQYNPERVYVPILRGLRPIQIVSENKFDNLKDNYQIRTSRDYFENTKVAESEIFTGQRLYQDLKTMLLGKREERNRVRQFEDFLSKTFFKNETVSLTPSIKDDSVHVLIGKEEYAIYDIGDGIQSIIIMLYPLFFNQGKNLLVFIEEPENSLHPGLQRLFLETLMRKEFSTFQYFITTHSNHFLDITLELDKVSVYTFKKELVNEDNHYNFSIQNISNQDSQILDLIGARSSSVFLSNCTIWVEGITDRLYLRKYLEVYQNYLISQNKLKSSFREDFNYSFVEYSGSNIAHWSFSDEAAWNKINSNRISSKIFLIADRDNSLSKPDSAKAKRLRLLKKQLGDSFRIVKGREIENTLSPKTIIDTILKLEDKNSSNIKFIKEEIAYEKYHNSKFGEFIEKHFHNLKNRKYRGESGTLYCKLDFCKAAISLITDFEDLSAEGKAIAKQIFNFVQKSNSI